MGKNSKSDKNDDVEISKSPFQRLVKQHTLSSQARKVATIRPTSHSPDSLDLALASTYDHHAIWGAGRANIVKQQKSCVDDHTAEFRKRLADSVSEQVETVNYKEFRGPYRDASYHAQLGIPPHHTSNSRRGYGRSLDGCFYST